MKVNQFFKRSEFACQCNCGFDAVDTVLLEILTVVRKHFDAATTITSGCRCEKHNELIGGAENSFHTKGKAADIKVKNITAADVYSFLIEHFPGQFGFILYSTWVHIDARNGMYRAKA
jgi:uncharacterized protein YcbK (DUF882 family)